KLRPVLQAEAAECGLASLAMVSAAHGPSVSLAELRRKFPLSSKGARLDQLIRVSQQLGLTARSMRLELVELVLLRVLCLLDWDVSHSVVLGRVGRGGAVSMDPAIGQRRLSLQEVSHHFPGIALQRALRRGVKRRRGAPGVRAGQLPGPVRGL